MTRLVQGVGINDRTYPAKIGGKNVKEYELWTSMLKRCNSTKYKEKFSTYNGCTTSENFKKYSYFYEWCSAQIGFGNVDFCLDKDILEKNNKVYSENTCVFIPASVNNLFTKANSIRGALPIGVHLKGKLFRSECTVYGKKQYIGTYDTPELAFSAYKTFKEAHIKELAEKYKDTIDPRAYQALLTYEVDIND